MEAKMQFFLNEPFILKRTIWPQLTIADYVVFNLLPGTASSSQILVRIKIENPLNKFQLCADARAT